MKYRARTARTVSTKARQASRRNIIRAQRARVGRKEPRSPGRELRKRQRYSKPTVRSRAPLQLRTRSR